MSSITFEEWWQKYTTKEMRADMKFYYHLSFDIVKAISEAACIVPSANLDIRIYTYPLVGSSAKNVLGVRFLFVEAGKVLYEQDLTPIKVSSPGELFEDDPSIPFFYFKEGNLHRKLGGKVEPGNIIDGEFIPDGT